jgi:predicted metal-dependent phosphoesterase TrpH
VTDARAPRPDDQGPAIVGSPSARVFIDLHCHTRASFDSLSPPASVVRVAAQRGLTHLIVTDHDRLDGALEARAAAPPELTVIVGQEIRTLAGDLIAAFVTEPIPRGLPAVEAIAAVRAQGGLVGIPHPFDRFRGSVGRDAVIPSLAPLVDWVEVHNARLVGRGNEEAAGFAATNRLPGVAVSDAHSLIEVGVAYTALDGDPSTPDGLLEALRSVEIVPGRASFVARLVTPVAKVVQRARGNGKGRRPSGAASESGGQRPR